MNLRDSSGEEEKPLEIPPMSTATEYDEEMSSEVQQSLYLISPNQSFSSTEASVPKSLPERSGSALSLDDLDTQLEASDALSIPPSLGEEDALSALSSLLSHSSSSAPSSLSSGEVRTTIRQADAIISGSDLIQNPQSHITAPDPAKNQSTGLSRSLYDATATTPTLNTSLNSFFASYDNKLRPLQPPVIASFSTQPPAASISSSLNSSASSSAQVPLVTALSAQVPLVIPAPIASVLSSVTTSLSATSTPVTLPTSSIASATIASTIVTSTPVNSTTSSSIVPNSASINIPMATTSGQVPAFNPVQRPDLSVLKAIPVFNTDSSTPEAADRFFTAFEALTQTWDPILRLNTFSQKLRGQTGETWWNNANITDWAVLKRRFHSRFIHVSEEERMRQLRNASRRKHEPVDSWADRIQSLTKGVGIKDADVIFRYFIDGLKNSRCRSIIDNSTAGTIEDVITLLLSKDLLNPLEESHQFNHREQDSDHPRDRHSPYNVRFEEDNRERKQEKDRLRRKEKESQETKNLRAQISLLNRQMADLVSTQQRFIENQVTQQQVAPSRFVHHPKRSPFGHQSAHVNLVTQSPEPQVGIRQGPDLHTVDGQILCGRCHTLGCSRATCPRQHGTCNNCGQVGHYKPECTRPAQARTFNRPQPSRFSPQQTPKCYGCGKEGHYRSRCPIESNRYPPRPTETPISYVSPSPGYEQDVEVSSD